MIQDEGLAPNENQPKEVLIKTEKDLKEKEKKRKKKKKSAFSWPIKSFFISLIIAAVFSLFSEAVVMGAHIIVSFFVIILLLFISIMSDMFAIALISCDIAPFTAMSARKIRGGKTCVFLLKRAETVSSILCDVVGDICAIVSGAAGTGIVAALLVSLNDVSATTAVVLTVMVSSLIGAFTVSLKAFTKVLGRKHCNKITLFMGKAFSIFNPNEPKAKRKKDKKA